MTTTDVARRLGFVFSPAQNLYRFYRRRGVPRLEARRLARVGAGQQAVSETLTVLRFIEQNAQWLIPDSAYRK